MRVGYVCRMIKSLLSGKSGRAGRFDEAAVVVRESVRRRKRLAGALLLAGLLGGVIFFFPRPVRGLSSNVVISQVYGGGGGSTGTWQNDYVELFNRGNSAVTLSGYSLQYGSSTGNFGSSTSNIYALTAVTLQPGQYYLVRLGATGTGGAMLPVTPDQTTSNLSMSGTAGKVALASITTALGCGATSTPCTLPDARIIDSVAYGTSNNGEGGTTVNNSAALTATQGAVRKGAGCTETDNNRDDFDVVTGPVPRNSSTTPAPCGGSSGPTLSINDVSQAEGDSGTTNFSFTVTLSEPAPTGGVTFDIATANGTATAGSDYVASSLTARTIAAGSTTYTFTVVVTGDTVTEANETFSVSLTNASGATLGDGQGAGTIVNDDVTPVAISAIQGSGATSPIVGSLVYTQGVVTGVRSSGFYIQTPDGSTDSNPLTSEGILVFVGSTPPAAAAVGNLVQVFGTVTEYVPSTDPLQPPLTELTSPTVTLISSGNTLPAPVALTATFPDPAGAHDQLERVEGMRVSVSSLTVVAPTDGSVTEASATATSTGVFHGVVTGVARPFREPGIESPDPAPSGTIPPIPRFDGNPERIRVDSDALTGTTALNLATGAVVTGLVGPLDYSYRTYTIMPEPGAAISVSGGMTATAVSYPQANQFTVASYNLERFFDTVNDPAIGEPVLTTTAYSNRLAKASLAIRNFLRTPDILGVVEVENLSTLQALAARISSDAIAAGQPDPQYSASLVEGNDVGGIDVGFLVRASVVSGTTPRVTVNAVVQEGKSTLFTNANGTTETLHDRPPLRLMATINHPNGASFDLTVIVNHLRSLNDVNDDTTAGSNGWTTAGARVRAKRQKQAEDLAAIVQARQAANPLERILLIGDFNAFEFNDGFVDSIGVISGMPTPDNQTVVPGDGVDLVNPDLTNLSAAAAASDRYSYSYLGNAQTLDHVLINSALISATSARHVEHPRINADFPETDRNSATSAVRLSDHDPVVGYFTVDAFCSSTLTVNTLADTADVNVGDGYCVDSSGKCSLRAALQEAAAFTGCVISSIDFSVEGTIELTGVLPDITRSLSIIGPGADRLTIRRNTGGSYRIFNISIYGLEVSISGVTLSNGDAGSQAGGAIFSASFLSLSKVSVINNFAGKGGGILLVGASAYISQSTISGNVATSSSGGGIAYIDLPPLVSNEGRDSANLLLVQTLQVENTTISGNSAVSGGSGVDLSLAGLQAEIFSSTIAANTGGTAGVALQADGMRATFRNSILSGNTGTSGGLWRSGSTVEVVSQGHNLTSDATGSLLGAATDRVSVDPLLSALGNYGGETPTHALLPGSPAIDGGSASQTVDQRGITRTGTADIGAFESQGFILLIGSGSGQETPAQSAFASPLSVQVVPFNTLDPVNGGRVVFTTPTSGASATILGTPATIVAGGAATGTVTANGIEGNYVANATTTGVQTPVTFELRNNTRPAVISILRAGSTPTVATSVAFTVTFSESVTGLTAANFTVAATPAAQMTTANELALTGNTAPSVSSVTGSGTTWTVNVAVGNFIGQLGLNLTSSSSVVDNLGSTLSNLPYTGQTYTIITAPKADLVIQKTGPAQVQTGGTITYTLDITNIGPQSADGATFTDTLPAGLTGLAGMVCSQALGGAVCPGSLSASGGQAGGTIPTLPARGRVVITITGTAPGSATTLFNSATVAPPSGTVDPVLANNVSNVTTTVSDAPPSTSANLRLGLAGTSTQQVNGRMRFRFRVFNSGPGSANGAIFSSSFSGGGGWVIGSCTGYGGAFCVQVPGVPLFRSADSQNTVSEAIPTLPAGGQVVFEVEGDAPSSPQTVEVAALLTPPPGVVDPDAGGGAANLSANIQNNPPSQANLSLVKTGSTTVTPGGQVSYTIVVTNNGPAAADGATVEDSLSSLLSSAGVTCDASGGAACGASAIDGSNKMTSTITTLPSGGTVTLTVTATAPASGNFANIASVTPPAGVSDPEVDDNLSGVVNTTVLPCPTIAVTPAALSAGSTTSNYNVTFSRNGGVGATTWSLAGTLPTGLTFNTNTGAISGTPTTAATFTFTVRATDANGCFGERSYTVSTLGQTFFEGDLAPLPNGDNVIDVTDWVKVGRFVIGLDAPQGGGEFQRADVAPLNTLGDGQLNVSDWVQTGRYAVGLDQWRISAGPGSPVALAPPLKSDQVALLRVIDTRLVEGEIGTAEVELDTSAEVNAVGFTLRYDPTQVAIVDLTADSGHLLVNRLNEAEGRLRVALALPPGQHFPAGAGRVLRLHLLPVAGQSRQAVSISIDGSLTSLQAVSPAAQPITLNPRGEAQLVIEYRPRPE